MFEKNRATVPNSDSRQLQGLLMNLDQLNLIKKLAIMSVFSEDTLLDILVLKGGNALDIIYKIAPRASIDLDFSMSSEFNINDMPSIQAKLERALTRTFADEGFKVFDVKFSEQPENFRNKIPSFWGGYKIEFKIIEEEKFADMSQDKQKLRVNALDIGPSSRKTYGIDISKWEYCDKKIETSLEDYTICVYTPEMIAIEKLRAICQQMPEYCKSIGKSFSTQRARDFFDIHAVIGHFGIDLTTSENLQLTRDIFDAKKVPLDLIDNINKYREYHRQGFVAVLDTVKPNIKVKDFNFYFDYVLDLTTALTKALRKI